MAEVTEINKAYAIIILIYRLLIEFCSNEPCIGYCQKMPHR